MPSTIPFDPSLVLGNIADPGKIAALEAVAEAKRPIDLAQDDLNSLIATERSLAITLQELINMQVDSKDLSKFTTQINKVKSDLAKQAGVYATTVLAQGPKVQAAKKKVKGSDSVNAEVESPIDWNKSSIKKMDISSDSMSVDAQYIRNENEQDGSDAHASSLAAHASAKVSTIFGPSWGAQCASSVHDSVLSQTSNHSIEGTLIITATCTHKAADIFAPFILDPEKGIRAWNVYNTGQGKSINTTDEDSMAKRIKDQTVGMKLISGATYGSSFVGMAHILKMDETTSSQSSRSSTTALETQFEEGGFFAHMEGRFGVDAEFSNNVKNMLSTSNVQAHADVITMGIIPTLKSNEVASSVKTLQPSAQDVMDQLASVQSASDNSVNAGMAAGAKKARDGASFKDLNSDYLKTVVSSLKQGDIEKNKVIDTNSLMTAFDDYVVKAAEGKAGIPINFFLKPITASQLVCSYLAKFSPMKYWQLSSGDDAAKSEKEKQS